MSASMSAIAAAAVAAAAPRAPPVPCGGARASTAAEQLFWQREQLEARRLVCRPSLTACPWRAGARVPPRLLARVRAAPHTAGGGSCCRRLAGTTDLPPPGGWRGEPAVGTSADEADTTSRVRSRDRTPLSLASELMASAVWAGGGGAAGGGSGSGGAGGASTAAWAAGLDLQVPGSSPVSHLRLRDLYSSAAAHAPGGVLVGPPSAELASPRSATFGRRPASTDASLGFQDGVAYAGARRSPHTLRSVEVAALGGGGSSPASGSSPGRHVAEPRARLTPSAGPVTPLPRPQRPRSLSSRLALPEAAAEELRRLAPGRTGSTRDVF